MNSITSPKRPKKDFIIPTSKSIKKIRKQNINVVNIKKGIRYIIHKIFINVM